MTEHVIVPFESFGPVRFGMTVAEVEAVMGRPDMLMTHNPGRPQHHYTGFGRVEFIDGRCASVESFPNKVEPVVEGIRLVGTFAEAVAALVEAGHEVDGEDDWEERHCPSLGVGLWREGSDDEQLGSVSAWGRGYEPLAA